MKRRLALTLPAVGLTPSLAQAAVRVVGASATDDPRYQYPLRLLQAVLQAAGLPAELAIQAHMEQPLAAQALAQGQLDIALLSTQAQQVDELLPIRFPIRRGLLGVRLLLARRESLSRFRGITTLSALQRGFVMGYGADWQDRALLQRLGFRMHLEEQYPQLFRELAQGRFDYLSRGVNEIWAELDHPLLVPKGLVVVPGLALSYPLDDYFYLGPTRRAWLPLMQAGLQQLWDNGSYHRLFQQTFGLALQRADFAKRRILQVVGYGVAKNTPMDSFDALELRGSSAQLKLPS